MLQEAIDHFMEVLSSKESNGSGGKQNTIMAYRNDLSQLCHYFDAQDVGCWSEVTREQITAYLLEIREKLGYRPATVARKFAALKTFFRHLYESGSIVYDPIEKLESPRLQKDLPHVLSIEEIADLFAHVGIDTPGGVRDLAMLHVLYATGMRASELIALDVDDFDSAHAKMRYPANGRQSRRDRFLPLSVSALQVLSRYLEQARPRLLRYSSESSLFLNHHGERLTRQGFWLIIKGYARDAGIQRITPHLLRHSFAILMLKEGMELHAVQQLLGHAHISTTQVYSQIVSAQEDKHNSSSA